MKKNIVLILIILSSISGYSQSKTDYEIFINAAQNNSLINNGTVPITYIGIKEGHCFIYTPEFFKGTICYDGKLYYDILLNINAHLDEVYLRHDQTGNISVLSKESISELTIGQRHYINFRKSNMSGFFELLSDGEICLYKRVKKIFYENISNRDLIRGFTADINLYVEHNNVIHTVKKPKDIYRMFPEQKREIRTVMKNKGITFKGDREKYLLTVIEWLNSYN